MSTNDIAGPTVEEADLRAERAKASLLSRVELLKHKLADVRRKLDLPAQIAQHPLPAIGIAFALGVLAGLGRTRSATPGEPARYSFKSAAFAALTAFGLRVLKDMALSQLAQFAHEAVRSERQHEMPCHNENEEDRLAARAP